MRAIADGGDGRPRRALRQAACRGGLDCSLGARARAERTWNMYCMVVTLEVSKLSGRLNATAPCRESKGGHTMLDMVRAGRQEAEGVRGVSLGARARSERTWNM